MTIDHLLFLLMSLIWGVTWIATKAGLAAVPPLFFGAARYILVSAVLVFVVRDLRAVFGGGRALRIIVTGTLVVVATYAFLYWGMLYVASGVAGVVNMSMNPVFLFALAILFGQERPTWRHALALVLGIGGLLHPVFRKGELRRHDAGTVGRGRRGGGFARLLPRLGADAAAAATTSSRWN